MLNEKTAAYRSLRLGAAWYPEQYPAETWAGDMAMMRDLGLNTVRVGEFAWACLEPSPGEYTLEWLVEAMDLLASHEIGCVLCTPTATPPGWLIKKHPEIGYVEPDGYRHQHGARQHASYNNPIFRDHSRQITQVLAEALGHHPALVAWQTDNELGSHQQRCMGPESIAKWHTWLRLRYGTIEALNEDWRTVVWSQRYDAFDEVPPPYRLCYYTHNYALTANYRRFMADAIAEFQQEQVAVIRQFSDAPITHNSTELTDDWRLSRALDFASSDMYTSNKTPTHIHFRFDSMRNLLPRVPFWTMETGCDGFIEDELFKNGWLGCFSFINYTMGAGGLCFWPWKQQPGGAEILNKFIVHANGQPSAGWHNVRETVQVMRHLDPVLKEFRPKPAETVFVRSQVNGDYFFADKAGGLEPNYNYAQRLHSCYQTLHDLGIWRDVYYDEAEMPSCRLLFSPYLPYLNESFIEQALDMVERGAVWIAGPYSGFRTRDNAVHTDYLFGKLEERVGFRTLDLQQPGSLEVEIAGRPGWTNQLAAMFEADAADEVLGTYATERFKGLVWGLRRNHGKGAIYLPGTELDDDSRRVFLKRIFEREKIQSYDFPERMTFVPLCAEDGREALALCNWSDHTRRVSIGQKCVLASAFGVEEAGEHIIFQPRSWAVAELSPHPQSEMPAMQNSDATC